MASCREAVRRWMNPCLPASRCRWTKYAGRSNYAQATVEFERARCSWVTGDKRGDGFGAYYRGSGARRTAGGYSAAGGRESATSSCRWSVLIAIATRLVVGIVSGAGCATRACGFLENICGLLMHVTGKPAGSGVRACGGGVDHRVPLRDGAGYAGGHHGGHECCGAARHFNSRWRGLGTRRADYRADLRQNRHADPE